MAGVVHPSGHHVLVDKSEGEKVRPQLYDAVIGSNHKFLQTIRTRSVDASSASRYRKPDTKIKLQPNLQI